MNSVGMASITALYRVHTEERKRRTLPWQLVPRATVVDADRTCWPTCTPSGCPILFAFLSYDDTHEEVRRFLKLVTGFTVEPPADIEWPIYHIHDREE